MYIREIFLQYTQPLGWLCTAAMHSRWLCTATGLAVHSCWAGCAQPLVWLCTAVGLAVHSQTSGCAQLLGWLCTATGPAVHSRWSGCAQPLVCTKDAIFLLGWLCTAAGLPVLSRCVKSKISCVIYIYIYSFTLTSTINVCRNKDCSFFYPWSKKKIVIISIKKQS